MGDLPFLALERRKKRNASVWLTVESLFGCSIICGDMGCTGDDAWFEAFVLHLHFYWRWEFSVDDVERLLHHFKLEWTFCWAEEGVLQVADA